MSSIVSFNICNSGNEFVTASSEKPNNVRISRFSEEAAWWTHAQAIFSAAKEAGEKRRNNTTTDEERLMQALVRHGKGEPWVVDDSSHITLLLQAYKKHGHGTNNQLAIKFEGQPNSFESPLASNKAHRDKAITAFAQSIFPTLPRNETEEMIGVGTVFPRAIDEADHKAIALYKESWTAYDIRVKAVKDELDLVIPSSGHAINDNIVTYAVSLKETLPVYPLYQAFTSQFLLPCELEDVLPRVIACKESSRANAYRTANLNSVVISDEDLMLRINGIVQQYFITMLFQYFIRFAKDEPSETEFLKMLWVPDLPSDVHSYFIEQLHDMLLTEKAYDVLWDGIKIYDYRRPIPIEEQMENNLKEWEEALKKLKNIS